jgi:pimeloyl-ACP methyl ester carboxylesterase
VSRTWIRCPAQSRAVRVGGVSKIEAIGGVESIMLMDTCRSPMPALVLVHGNGHASDCWELCIEKIRRLAPALTVLAVDLPGRRGKPGDLRTLTIADCVESVVCDIEDAGLRDLVIVGHSMAGLTIPGVVTKLGSSRVREMILAAACVPPEGQAALDTLNRSLASVTRRTAKRSGVTETPYLVAQFLYFNGIPRARRRFMVGKLFPESVRMLTENVSRHGMPDEVPRTWIMTLRDRVCSVTQQGGSIDAIGGVETIIPISTCHDLMVSEPELLAQILVERWRLRSGISS